MMTNRLRLIAVLAVIASPFIVLAVSLASRHL